MCCCKFISHCDAVDLHIISYLNFMDKYVICQINRKFLCVIIGKDSYQDWDQNMSLLSIIKNRVFFQISKDIHKMETTLIKALYQHFCFPSRLNVRENAKELFLNLEVQNKVYNVNFFDEETKIVYADGD